MRRVAEEHGGALTLQSEVGKGTQFTVRLPFTLAVTQGQLELAGETFRAGDFAIIPSSMEDASRDITSRSADAQWLEIRIPG